MLTKIVSVRQADDAALRERIDDVITLYVIQLKKYLSNESNVLPERRIISLAPDLLSYAKNAYSAALKRHGVTLPELVQPRPWFLPLAKKLGWIRMIGPTLGLLTQAGKTNFDRFHLGVWGGANLVPALCQYFPLSRTSSILSWFIDSAPDNCDMTIINGSGYSRLSIEDKACLGLVSEGVGFQLTPTALTLITISNYAIFAVCAYGMMTLISNTMPPVIYLGRLSADGSGVVTSSGDLSLFFGIKRGGNLNRAEITQPGCMMVLPPSEKEVLKQVEEAVSSGVISVNDTAEGRIPFLILPVTTAPTPRQFSGREMRIGSQQPASSEPPEYSTFSLEEKDLVSDDQFKAFLTTLHSWLRDKITGDITKRDLALKDIELTGDLSDVSVSEQLKAAAEKIEGFAKFVGFGRLKQDQAMLLAVSEYLKSLEDWDNAGRKGQRPQSRLLLFVGGYGLAKSQKSTAIYDILVDFFRENNIIFPPIDLGVRAQNVIVNPDKSIVNGGMTMLYGLSQLAVFIYFVVTTVKHGSVIRSDQAFQTELYEDVIPNNNLLGKTNAQRLVLTNSAQGEAVANFINNSLTISFLFCALVWVLAFLGLHRTRQRLFNTDNRRILQPERSPTLVNINGQIGYDDLVGTFHPREPLPQNKVQPSDRGLWHLLAVCNGGMIDVQWDELPASIRAEISRCVKEGTFNLGGQVPIPSSMLVIAQSNHTDYEDIVQAGGTIIQFPDFVPIQAPLRGEATLSTASANVGLGLSKDEKLLLVNLFSGRHQFNWTEGALLQFLTYIRNTDTQRAFPSRLPYETLQYELSLKIEGGQAVTTENLQMAWETLCRRPEMQGFNNRLKELDAPTESVVLNTVYL